MANNSQFPGIQPPRPPLAPMGPPQSAHSSMAMQFRSAAPPPPPPPYMPVASQQFLPVGRPNIAPPPQSQQLQYSQPMQPGVQGHSLPPPPLPPPQVFPVPDVQPSRPIVSVSPQTQHSVPIANNYVPGLIGPRMGLPLPYNLSAPSTGQMHINAEATNQYQPTSMTNVTTFLPDGPTWSLDSQTTKAPPPVRQPVEQMLPAPSVPVTSDQPKTSNKVPSDWIEHTARTGKRYYYNKKMKLSSWEKPIELMSATERADASTDWGEYTAPNGLKYYHNKVTKISKWMMPEEVKLAREKLRNEYTSEEHEAMKNPDCEASAPSVSCVMSSTAAAETSSHSACEVASSLLPVAPVVIAVTPGPVVTAESSTGPIVSSTAAMNPVKLLGSVETMPVTTGVPEEISMPVMLDPATPAMSNSEDVSAKDAIAFPHKKDAVAAEDGTAVGDVAETKKGNATPEKANVAAVEDRILDQETPVYENKMEAKGAFMALLEYAKIASDWTWDQAMRVIINDRRYGALRTLGERKQAFNEFLGQKKKQEAEERRTKQKKAREEFKKMLEESKEITSSTRWSKAIAIFEDDDRFKAVERSKEREDLFEDHLVELEKKERAKALEEHRRKKMEYIEFLKSCDFITASSQWRKVQDRLEADERCSCLEKIDRLEIFQEYLRDLEKEEEEQRKLRMEELRKTERKNRDEFRKLMEGHVASGVLTSKTHWRDYCIKVKDSSAYLAVSSNTTGATPKDLFEDVIEELEKQYLEDKDRIKEAVKIRKVAILSTWTLEDFKTAIAEDISSSPISDANLKIVLDELQERVREREEKEAKRRKRLADDFYVSLSTSKEITSSSQWEDFKPLFEERQENWFTVEENFFREIFDKYIAELKDARDERKRREDKAKKNIDAKDRERRKDKSRSEKDRSKKEKKYRKRERSSHDDASMDIAEKDQPKNSHRHSSESKKMKQMELQVSASVEYDSRHKRCKRDHVNDTHRRGEYEDQKEKDYGEDGEVW